MSPLPPSTTPPREPATPPAATDPACRVNNVIPTSAIFAAALERLNRNSTIELFQKLTQELDAHCRTLSSIPLSGAPDGQSQAELLALLTLLRQTTEQHLREVAAVQQQLTDLQALSIKTNTDLEGRISTLFNQHIEQSMTPALAAASARLEQSAAAAVARDLNRFGEQLLKDIKAREQRRRRWAWVALLLLLLLLGVGGALAIGLLSGRRSAVACPPAPQIPACIPQCATTPAQSGQSKELSLGQPKTNPASVSAGIIPDSSPAGAGASHGQGAVGDAEPAGHNPSFTSVGDSRIQSAAQAAKPIKLRVGLTELALQPGSMEEELVDFLKRPDAQSPRTFTMDRLHYPTQSHEVPAAGKEQVYLLAQILHAYPNAQIEIRGHNDGTESEVYTGPKPYRDYTLSQLRADCVFRRLQNQNVPAARMRIKGMASTRPVTEDRTEEGRQRNRRVEIVVTKR